MHPIRLRLIFNNNINNGKPTFTWKQNNTLLNDTLVKEGIKKEITEVLNFNENEDTTKIKFMKMNIAKVMGYLESCPKKKTNSSEYLQKETRESTH